MQFFGGWQPIVDTGDRLTQCPSRPGACATSACPTTWAARRGVGAANDTHTWKLPYLLADGITPDAKRLPKAIQCNLSNYPGAQVDIPETDVGDVMECNVCSLAGLYNPKTSPVFGGLRLA